MPLKIQVIVTSYNRMNRMVSEEVDMNVENEEDAGIKVEHVDCYDAFNTSQVFV